MNGMELLKEQENKLTEEINSIADRLALGNLDPEIKTVLVNRHQQVWSERQEFRRKIEELTLNPPA
jgi:hypothetical protein